MKLRSARLIFHTMLTVFIGTSAVAAGQPRAMTLVDLLEIPSLSSPRFSPDGSQLLYLLAKADWKANKQIRHVWRMDVAGGDAVQLTNRTNGETSPRWSPDGNWVAFLANRGEYDDEEIKDQIYLISNRGGEAQALTNRPNGAKNISWSPDGKFIYFLSPDPKSPEQIEREKLKDDVFAFDENYQHVHLWKIAIADKAESRITQGDYSVLDYQHSNDGTKAAFHRSINPLFGDSDQGEVWVMNADGTGAKQLTRNHVPETSARISPDNKHVLFLTKANEKFEYYFNANLFLVPATGGVARRLLPDLPYEILVADWSRDGQSIFFTANMGAHVELFQLDVANRKLKQLTNGNHAIRSWHYCAGVDRHVMSIDQPENPGDVWMIASRPSADSLPATRKQLTHVFDGLTQQFRLPRQERITWRGTDGVEIEGLLFYPLDYQKGKRYPLIVQAHGGPAHSDRFGFGAWRDYIPILTARGYAIIKPNYRGSTGYGNAFLRDMVGHYFKNAHLDVMAGVDHLINVGIADGDRMAMMGWSGGGHMTNKIITFTNRFKAAASGAGAVNWISMYGQSDTRFYRTPWFGGTPWEKRAPIDVFWEHSPLKHVANVKTPTIILVGEKDWRVPMPQSVELYRALKSNGVATHLYVAPRAPHGWDELRHRLFKMNVELDWFAKHVRGTEYTWEKAPTLESGDAP
jgi:dipeptidyl aminopeptidase/acylaminoacyl peptidase